MARICAATISLNAAGVVWHLQLTGAMRLRVEHSKLQPDRTTFKHVQRNIKTWQWADAITRL
jgi:hypothetical protein